MKICLNCKRLLSEQIKQCIYCGSSALESCTKLYDLSEMSVNIAVPPTGEKKYKIVDSIGGGAYGYIYSVKEISTGKPFAMKVPLIFGRVYCSTQAGSQREKQADEVIKIEIKNLKTHNHRNIISLRDSGEITTKSGDKIPFFIMDILEGSVDSLIGRISKISPIERIKITKETSAGLSYLHSNKTVYRDLSLKNIGIVDRGRGDGIGYLIFDFGTARLTDAASLSLQGTYRYICPSYFQDNAKYSRDPRIDVYSLGVAATELMLGITDWSETYKNSLTTDNPILANFSEEVVKAENIIEKNRGINYKILENITDILKRATQRDIDKRYKNCIEFKEEFDKATKDLVIEPVKIKINVEIKIRFPFNFSGATFALTVEEYQEGRIIQLADPRGIEVSLPFSKPKILTTGLPSFYEIIPTRYNSFQLRLNENKLKEKLQPITNLDPKAKGELVFKGEIELEAGQ